MARQTEARATHARYFAEREADIVALWDSPRQREAYEWFSLELANLRTAFRWAADHGGRRTWPLPSPPTRGRSAIW